MPDNIDEYSKPECIMNQMNEYMAQLKFHSKSLNS